MRGGEGYECTSKEQQGGAALDLLVGGGEKDEFTIRIGKDYAKTDQNTKSNHYTHGTKTQLALPATKVHAHKLTNTRNPQSPRHDLQATQNLLDCGSLTHGTEDTGEYTQHTSTHDLEATDCTAQHSLEDNERRTQSEPMRRQRETTHKDDNMDTSEKKTTRRRTKKLRKTEGKKKCDGRYRTNKGHRSTARRTLGRTQSGHNNQTTLSDSAKGLAVKCAKGEHADTLTTLSCGYEKNHTRLSLDAGGRRTGGGGNRRDALKHKTGGGGGWVMVWFNFGCVIGWGVVLCGVGRERGYRGWGVCVGGLMLGGWMIWKVGGFWGGEVE
uniref:Uncharacterized protein n=1 Tax=Knipowitschia caucasica TaxID=637954 RepID=A0AAV2KP40_KNICA